MKTIPNEQMLLLKIQNEDDDSSFKVLFDRYWETLFLHALKKTKSLDLAMRKIVTTAENLPRQA